MITLLIVIEKEPFVAYYALIVIGCEAIGVRVFHTLKQVHLSRGRVIMIHVALHTRAAFIKKDLVDEKVTRVNGDAFDYVSVAIEYFLIARRASDALNHFVLSLLRLGVIVLLSGELQVEEVNGAVGNQVNVVLVDFQ